MLTIKLKDDTQVYKQFVENESFKAERFVGDSMVYAMRERECAILKLASIPVNHQKAARWYKRPATEGNANAQFNLAYLYFNGYGVTKDEQKAAYWGEKAAEQGLKEAQSNIAGSYAQGIGVNKNLQKAVYWYKKAAEQGDEHAQFQLGFLYHMGRGILQDEIMAYAYWSLAAIHGGIGAMKNRDMVAENLTKQELLQGRKIAADLQRKIEINKSSESTANPEESVTNEPELIGTGSAFIITTNGYIITCQHVIDGASKIKVAAGNTEYTAKLISTDKYNDLALLKIDGSFAALSFAPRSSAKMGSDVFTIGYPNPSLQGVNQKLTAGNINALTGFQDDIRLYQISVPVQPGNSGGALVNENGDVVGIIVAILKAETAFKITGSLPQNVNYALKSTYAQALIDTVPDAISGLQKPHSNRTGDLIERVSKSVLMVFAYK
jgi:uncharacterized protein